VNGSIDRVSVTKRIAAPAHQVFLIVTDPACHIEIDGSGMLRGAGAPRQLSAVGDTFDIEMDRQPLDEIVEVPGLARHYTIRNAVTRIVADRLVEWAPARIGQVSNGRVYGWEIEPVDDDACDVTNYCDWSAISDELRAKFPWPIVPASMLERSAENLAQIATRR
jgi:hypothetical protein